MLTVFKASSEQGSSQDLEFPGLNRKLIRRYSEDYTCTRQLRGPNRAGAEEGLRESIVSEHFLGPDTHVSRLSPSMTRGNSWGLIPEEAPNLPENIDGQSTGSEFITSN